MFKWILIILLLFSFSVCAAEDLTLTPNRLDTYFLYSGLGEEQTSEYKFIANRNVVKCEMLPADNAMCAIENGHVVLVRYSTVGAPYEGQVKITDDTGFVMTSDMLVRIYDIGIYAGTGTISVGESVANSSAMNLFFATDDTHIIGIRWWVIVWLLILIGVILLKEI